jgi:hypothetical protein
MGCSWTTVRGKRVRIGPAGPAVISTSLAIPTLANLMGRIGISLLAFSPAVSVDELQNAVLRLWFDPEKGYMVEARRTPGSPPIYHSISQLEATSLESGRPTPELLGRLFHRDEPVDN